MKKMLAILKRELLSFLASPMGYIILAAYTFIIAWFFFSFLNATLVQLHQNPAGLYTYQVTIIPRTFAVMIVVLLLITSALTMRSIAEEKSSGTIQLLLTAPVRDIEVIGGKFGASFIFFLCIIGASVVFPLIVYFSTGSADQGAVFNWGRVLSGYMGIILLSALFCACGVFISSLVDSQVVAAVLTLVFLIFSHWILGQSGRYFPGRVGGALSYFSFENHVIPFIQGVISTEHIVFFLSTASLFIFLSVKSLEKRKWSNLLEDETSKQLFSFDPFWPGALFCWALFLLMFIIMPTYDRISMFVFIAGCVFALIWTIKKRRPLAALFRSGRGRAGANVILSTGMVCAVYIMISLANHQYHKMWDVTSGRVQSLSPATKKLIDRMNTEAEIVTFISRHNAPDIFQWYDQYSSKIKVRYYDPVYFRSRVETIARETGQSSLEDYIVIKNRKAESCRGARLVNVSRIPSPKILEEEIDLQLLSLMHEAGGKKKKKVYFLTGHGEANIDDTSAAGLSKLAFLLEKEYIDYSKLFIYSAKKVPGDCDLLIIIGPGHEVSEDTGITKTYFTPEEVRILRDYLDRERRNLLVCAGPGFSRIRFADRKDEVFSGDGKKGLNPALFINRGGLLGLLAEKGFLLTNGIILNNSFSAEDNAVIFLRPRRGNRITQQKPYQMFLPYSTLVLAGANRTIEPFFTVPAQSWIEDILDSDRKYSIGDDGPMGTGLAGAYRIDRSEKGMPDRRIALIGSSKMATNQYIDIRNNREVLRDTVNWLLGKESFSITRNFNRVTLTMSKHSRDAIFYISIVVIPFIFLGIAVLVWWERR